MVAIWYKENENEEKAQVESLRMRSRNAPYICKEVSKTKKSRLFFEARQ